MRFIKITTSLTKDDMNNRFYKLSFEEQQEAIDVNALIIASVELYYSTGSVAFYVIDDYAAYKIFELYDKVLMPYRVYDMTTEALNNFFNASDKEVKSALKIKEFQNMLKSYRMYNLSIDLVLDKILKCGLSC